MEPIQPQLHERVRAYVLVGLNLLALPGLGTFLAGQRISGLLQVVLAVAGFLLSARWFSQFMTVVMNAEELPDLEAIPFRLLAIGLAIAVAAWLWSLVSSLQILRAARKTKP